MFGDLKTAIAGTLKAIDARHARSLREGRHPIRSETPRHAHDPVEEGVIRTEFDMSIYNSIEFLKAIRKNPENFFIIHYSCESLHDNNDTLLPRITSIAINHYATEQMVSFSTHSIAEELHISRDEVHQKFDEVERKLLSDFHAFVIDRRDKFWIHWNMRDLNFGFEHLKHRFGVLGGGDALSVPVEKRLNLNDMLSGRYGEDYANHPRLKSLMELNGGTHRHFLTGEQEVQAFQNNEFIRMHNSTLAKVGFFRSTVRKFAKGKLRTASTGVGARLDRIFEHRVSKIIAAAATVLTIPVACWQIFLWIFGS